MSVVDVVVVGCECGVAGPVSRETWVILLSYPHALERSCFSAVADAVVVVQAVVAAVAVVAAAVLVLIYMIVVAAAATAVAAEAAAVVDESLAVAAEAVVVVTVVVVAAAGAVAGLDRCENAGCWVQRRRSGPDVPY